MATLGTPPIPLEDVWSFIRKVIEARDAELSGHHFRASTATVKLARALGCNSSEIDLLGKASILHDIGKLGIPESILQKPSRLTQAEFELVKQHVAIGEGFIDSLQVDPSVLATVTFHHENFDGSGYLKGLRGDDIPYSARVMRITDSFDALTGSRPYNRPVAPIQAVAILQKDERFYDPHMLRCFCKLVEDNKL